MSGGMSRDEVGYETEKLLLYEDGERKLGVIKGGLRRRGRKRGLSVYTPPLLCLCIVSYNLVRHQS